MEDLKMDNYNIFRRVMEKKHEVMKSWDEVVFEAEIPLRSWMTGIMTSNPTDAELKAIAPVLNTTFEWLKYGK